FVNKNNYFSQSIKKIKSINVFRLKLFFISSLIIFSVVIILVLYCSKYINNYSKFDQENNVLKQIIVFPRGGDDLKFNQPWELPKRKIYKNIEELIRINNNKANYITGDFTYSPGLGNLMFQYAALRILAERENAYLLLPYDCKLRRAFNLDEKVLFIEAKFLQNLIEENEAINIFEPLKFYKLEKITIDCCKYIPKFEYKINFTQNVQNIAIVNGYFQSFRYFHFKYSQLIAKNFNFIEGIKERAKIILNKILIENNKSINTSLLIGIHVRHGIDLTMHQRNQRYGHKVATVDYYKNAMKYFIKNKNNTKIIFLIVSDNISWAKRNIKIAEKNERISNVYYTSHYREIDMAILSKCNHLIISTGTFSWWSAYLLQLRINNAQILYFGDWPKSGSLLEKIVEKKDYFLPSWIMIK
ncbi:L-Fucosyltransferase, partial [Meloidogyne graminicola]